MQKPPIDPEAVRAMETVFRSSHGREMSPEERRYFKLPEARSRNGDGAEPASDRRAVGPTKVDRGVVAWLISRSDKLLLRKLETLGFKVLEAHTADKLVADCVNQPVEVVILDQNFFVETAGWSVARSVKHIKPHAYVILVARQSWPHDRLPKGVDAIVPVAEPQQLLGLLEQLHA